MPIYEYVCGRCQEHVEKMQKISDPPLKKCPDCGGPLKKLMSSTTFVLKGGGWYKDGYGPSTVSKSESTTSPSSGTEATKAAETAKPEKTAGKASEKADKAIAA